MGETLLLNKFFPIVDMCLCCKDIAQHSYAMVPRWRIFGQFLGAAFTASHVQHVSDVHPKFALKATSCVEVWQTSNLRRLRLGEEKKIDRNHSMKIYMVSLLHRATIKN